MNKQRPSLESYLARELHGVRRRLVARQFATWTAALWIFQAFLIWLVADALTVPLDRSLLILLLSLSGLLAVVGAILVRRWSWGQYRSAAAVARPLESRFPELDSRLFAVVSAQDQPSSGRVSFLEDQVTREVLLLARRQRWSRVVPGWQIAVARGASLAALGIAVLASMALVFAPFTTTTVAQQGSGPRSPEITTSDRWQVTPGNVELEKGRSLLVTVRLPAPSPDPLEMVVTTDDGEVARYSLSQNLADPIYSTQLPQVQQSLDYRIETTHSATENFRVTVYELPELEELNIELQYPAFTRLSPKSMLDPRRVQAVEGTDLVMTARFNQPLQHARWDGPSGPLQMTPVPDQPNVYRGQLTVRETETLELALASLEGRQPAVPTSLKITALPNKPPEIRWMQPGYDPQVSPLEEVDIAGRATDDFGVVSLGLTFQLVGREPIEIRLDGAAAAEAGETVKAVIQEQVALESLEVKPGDLMQMYLWAEDRIEGEQTRRTLSDLLVAEVRDFEQIFRQSDQPNSPNQEQPPGGPQQAGQEQQQAQNLIERQKQVMLASWNLLRRDTDSLSWVDDVQLVLAEQMSIIEEVRPLLDQVPAEEFSAEDRLRFERAMVDAVDRLLEASQQQQAAPLQAGTEAQQVILQDLLRLVSNEFDVQQQQQAGQQGSPSSSRQAGSPNQQQLQQLQLDDDRNRYEQESQAQTVTDPEQQRQREQLNRLEDLARRQSDLNEQIKQLQAELEAAESAAEEEELRRRLERLREEQEQLLRDAEELQEDLAEDPNATREDRQQLEEARQSAQQSAQALANENVDQALAEGRRTEQALDQLKDELQQRTGNAFQEELDRLNQQLDQLSKTQNDVQQRLDEFFNDDAADLSNRDRTTPLVEQMEERSDQLEQVLDDLKDVIEASEDSEPLLSDELYEAFREAKQQQVERMAADSQRWVENGLPERSQPLENELQQRLDQLQQAVQRSSQFAGKDEISALRMAEATLRELSAEADPSQAADSESSEQSSSEQDPMGQGGDQPASEGEESGEGQPGEGQPGGGQPGEGQPGEGQPGEGQPGEGQPGEGQPGEGQPGEGQPGEGQPGEGQPGEGQPGEGQPGEGQPGEGQPGEGQPGQSPMGQAPQGGSPASGQPSSAESSGNPTRGGGNPLSAEQLLDRWSALAGPGGNPLTTDAYRDWIDRLREVEDLVPAGPLSEEAARIRQRAEAMRRDLQRHSELPDPVDIEEMIVKPLDSLARRVASERVRLEGKDPSVRLDRDPVPAEFADEVREYFQRLGAGRE